MADDYLVKDAAGAPFTKAAKDIGSGRKADLAVIPGISFTDVSVSSLSSGQAAGTATVRAANADRRSLILVPPSDCTLAIASGATSGLPLFGGVPNSFSGPDCPTNALYVVGLSAGAKLTIWEG